ncbi:hypothetical protein ACFCXA_24140 [Streptomyces virginiae]|uniref:hypothetical protein n=1 Tax=Streptomyces virginiae TaxID=1961 RepID=UPI0035DC241A
MDQQSGRARPHKDSSERSVLVVTELVPVPVRSYSMTWFVASLRARPGFQVAVMRPSASIACSLVRPLWSSTLTDTFRSGWYVDVGRSSTRPCCGRGRWWCRRPAGRRRGPGPTPACTSGRRLDVPGGRIDNGNQLQIYDCNATTAQRRLSSIA